MSKLKRKIALLVISIGVLIAVLIYTARFNESDCQAIEGSTYRSPRETDNFFGGTMYPEVSFAKGRFVWVITDMVIAGVYECKSGRIIAHTSYDSAQVTVQLDPDTDNLLWYGDMYIKISR